MANVDWGIVMQQLGQGVIQGIQIKQQKEELKLKEKAAKQKEIELMSELSKNIVNKGQEATPEQTIQTTTPPLTSTPWQTAQRPTRIPMPGEVPNYTSAPMAPTAGTAKIAATPAIPEKPITLGTAKEIISDETDLNKYKYKTPTMTEYQQRSLAIREKGLSLRNRAGQDKELSQAMQVYNTNMKMYSTTSEETYLAQAQDSLKTIMTKYNRVYPDNPITEFELQTLVTQEPDTFLGIPWGTKKVKTETVVKKGETTKGTEKKTGGKLMVDKNGNKAMVYPDGTFDEVK